MSGLKHLRSRTQRQSTNMETKLLTIICYSRAAALKEEASANQTLSLNHLATDLEALLPRTYPIPIQPGPGLAHYFGTQNYHQLIERIIRKIDKIRIIIPDIEDEDIREGVDDAIEVFDADWLNAGYLPPNQPPVPVGTRNGDN